MLRNSTRGVYGEKVSRTTQKIAHRASHPALFPHGGAMSKIPSAAAKCRGASGVTFTKAIFWRLQYVIRHTIIYMGPAF